MPESIPGPLELLQERFANQTALIFAPGPSLTKLWWADREIPFPSITIGNAWQITPSADILYHTDAAWWRLHKSVPSFGGVRIGYKGNGGPSGIIWLQDSGKSGFDPQLGWVRHGHNSGHAGIHLAAQLGAKRIVLVGFDQRKVDGKEHFFGDHPRELGRNPSPYDQWAQFFSSLSKELISRNVRILNATPGSALKIFPMVNLEDVLDGRS